MQVTLNSFVLNVMSLTLCSEHARIGSSSLNVINGPTTVASDLAIFVFDGIATVMLIMRVSCLLIDVTLVKK